jgi:hypothetical protein
MAFRRHNLMAGPHRRVAQRFGARGLLRTGLGDTAHKEELGIMLAMRL